MSGADTVWRVRHRAVTGSTNKDALGGQPGDVFTADHQTAGRGRLDHRWLSPPGENLMMSAVIDVSGVPLEEAATLPLVVGLAVAQALESVVASRQSKEPVAKPPLHLVGTVPRAVRSSRGTTALPDVATASKEAGAARADNPCAIRIKWPNDVLIEDRKVCGILCERKDDRVIAGLGVNVNQMVFDPEIAARATSLRLALGPASSSGLSVPAVRDAVLEQLAAVLALWRVDGFRAVWPEIAARDFLKGRTVAVRRTDDDDVPAAGLCGGIRLDGALDVGGEAVFAGEAHVCPLV